MKLYAVIIYTKNYVLRYSNYNLESFSFFESFILKQKIETVTKEIIQQIPTNNIYQINQTIGDKEFVIYGSSYNDYSVVITDKDYPSYVASKLLQLLNSSTNPDFDKLFDIYQNPSNIDKLIIIKKELEDSKIIIYDSIDKLIDRGEKMDELMNKTESLVRDSESFRVEAKKMNECCSIL
jgi:synaptobrevin family protein YKT6